MPCGSLARTRENRANRANRFKSHFIVDTEVTRLHLCGPDRVCACTFGRVHEEKRGVPCTVLRGRQNGFGLGEKGTTFA